MSRNRYKAHQKKREAGGFVPLPHVVLGSHAFTQLSPYAVKLLMDLLAQYRGDNNGDLCGTWSLMKERGWVSNATLTKAKQELLKANWIEISRQGGRHKATLYAVTFLAVDECRGKLDIASTHSPKGSWRLCDPAPAMLNRNNFPRPRDGLM